MFCSNCGKELPEGARFCNRCGAQVRRKTVSEPEPVAEPVFVPVSAPAPEPVFVSVPEPEPAAEPVFAPQERFERPEEPLRFTPDPEPVPVFAEREDGAQTRPQPLFEQPEEPETSRPLSPWAYFGFSLLFLIPVVGLILLIVFSVTAKNVNLKNFARSYWCGLVLVLAIVLIVLILALTGVLTGAFDAFREWVRSDLPGILSRVKLP